MATPSNYTLRIPPSLMEEVKDLAKQDDTSVNQFIVLAVAERVGALKARAYFIKRAVPALPLIAVSTNVSSLGSRIDGRYDKHGIHRLYQRRPIVEKAIDVIGLQSHSQQTLRTLEDSLVFQHDRDTRQGKNAPSQAAISKESRRPSGTIQSA